MVQEKANAEFQFSVLVLPYYYYRTLVAIVSDFASVFFSDP